MDHSIYLVLKHYLKDKIIFWTNNTDAVKQTHKPYCYTQSDSYIMRSDSSKIKLETVKVVKPLVYTVVKLQYLYDSLWMISPMTCVYKMNSYTKLCDNQEQIPY